MALVTPRAENHAQAAMEVFRTGIPAYAGDPMHSFRERMLRMSTGERSNASMKLAHLYTLNHAWNLFRRSEPVAMTKIRQTFTSPAGFNMDILREDYCG
jgi:hypothetical protein